MTENLHTYVLSSLAILLCTELENVYVYLYILYSI